MPDLVLERRSAGIMLSLFAAAAVAAYATHRYAPSKRRNFTAIRAMVPMRDGIKLETVVLVPKERRGPLPILLQRTPYGIPEGDSEPALTGSYADLIADGYLFAYQNLRGRYRSEGTFVMVRPGRDPRDPKSTDETTDAYDTVEWLVHNVPDNNGRVGMRGVSYDGWTTAMALVEPHPALKCASEQASPSDMFLNDDFHHNGAFRLSYGFEYSALMETAKDAQTDFDFDRRDTYEWYLSLGSLTHVDERYLHGTIPTWEDFVTHPNRDDFWSRRAIAAALKRTTIPNLNVAGWWDQEDFVGPLDIYARLEKEDPAQRNFLVVGPWNHGGWARGSGRSLGAIDFGSDTAQRFRALEAKWFAHCLHDAPLDLAEATVFETGSNQWRSFDQWPPAGATERRLYLGSGGKASFEPPPDAGEAFDSYVSDPTDPVPYRRRPIDPTYPGPDWPVWLVQDQRFADHRPDVLSWETDPLERDVVVDGNIRADLYASTSGTDSDWVVKLLDVYPDGPAPDAGATADVGSDGGAPADLRGYELLIAGEILRGRFRDGFEHPQPVPAGAVVRYAIDLHSNAHAFLKGHRIMVQVQSTWFPVYDRNPQKYVENIFAAKDEDFVKATQRVYRSREAPSSIVLSIAP
ncbi:MAG TPA: CocE/NonD family hydrolase [Polyangiaceae bacterium]|jgi:hypothetical protein